MDGQIALNIFYNLIQIICICTANQLEKKTTI